MGQRIKPRCHWQSGNAAVLTPALTLPICRFSRRLPIEAFTTRAWRFPPLTGSPALSNCASGAGRESNVRKNKVCVHNMVFVRQDFLKRSTSSPQFIAKSGLLKQRVSELVWHRIQTGTRSRGPAMANPGTMSQAAFPKTLLRRRADLGFANPGAGIPPMTLTRRAARRRRAAAP